MAGYNPFKIFRKHQKVALAVVGVGAMISFIILPAIMQAFSGFMGGSGPSEIARCRRYGNVNEQTLEMLRQNRIVLGRFYENLFYALAAPDGSNMTELRPLAAMAEEYRSVGDSEDLVDNWLLAQYAADQGIQIREDTIIDFLNQVTSGLLTDTVFSSVLSNEGLSHRQLEGLIAQEIMAGQMKTAFGISMRPVAPSTRWNWFQRLNRNLTAEVAAVPVDRFIKDVPEPSDSQLRKFFEDHKNNLHDSSVAEVGFTEPNKVAFQYVKGVPSQKLLDSIPKEDVEKYYEANKEPMFRKPTKPLADRPSLPGQTLPGQGGGLFQPGMGGFTPGTMPFPAPSTRTPPRSTNVISLTEEGDAATEEKRQTPSDEPARTEEAPKTEEPKEEPEKEEPAKEEPKQEQSGAVPVKREVATRFVSYQAEKETGQGAEPAKTEEKKPETEKQPEAKAEDKPAEVKPTDAAEEETVDLSILYQPLSEVENDIRQILAREKVEEALKRIENKMQEYYREYYRYYDQELPVPPMPDLSAMAREEGLVLESVELGDFYVGASSEFARGAKEREYLMQLYSDASVLFQPNIFQGDEGSVLVWIVESVPKHTPEKFDEVRETVLARWKEFEARPLAMKQAEQWVAEAKTSDKSLVEALSKHEDAKVVETEPFTWMTYGHGVNPLIALMQQQFPRYDRIREKGVAVGNAEIDNKVVFAAGKDFMEAAYDLPVGGVGAAFNQPQNTAYMIRIIGSSPSLEVLWEKFQSSYFQEYAPTGMFEERQEAMEVWMKKIRDEVGFQWIRKPTRYGGSR